MDHTAAIACYAAAADAATLAGHLRVAGLAHELAARAQLAPDPAGAATSIQQARARYGQWGAPALSAALDARLGSPA